MQVTSTTRTPIRAKVNIIDSSSGPALLSPHSACLFVSLYTPDIKLLKMHRAKEIDGRLVTGLVPTTARQSLFPCLGPLAVGQRRGRVVYCCR